MEVQIIVIIGLAVVALFVVAQTARILRNRTIHATMRKSLEAGHPLTPELIEKLDRSPEPGAADQRIAFVLIALGVGVILAGVIGRSNELGDLVAVSVFPLLVGAALLLRLRLSTRRRAEP